MKINFITSFRKLKTQIHENKHELDEFLNIGLEETVNNDGIFAPFQLVFNGLFIHNDIFTCILVGICSVIILIKFGY